MKEDDVRRGLEEAARYTAHCSRAGLSRGVSSEEYVPLEPTKVGTFHDSSTCISQQLLSQTLCVMLRQLTLSWCRSEASRQCMKGTKFSTDSAYNAHIRAFCCIPKICSIGSDHWFWHTLNVKWMPSTLFHKHYLVHENIPQHIKIVGCSPSRWQLACAGWCLQSRLRTKKGNPNIWTQLLMWFWPTAADLEHVLLFQQNKGLCCRKKNHL